MSARDESRLSGTSRRHRIYSALGDSVPLVTGMNTRVLDCELWNMHLHIKATIYPSLSFHPDSSDVEYTCNITFYLKAQHFVHTQVVYIRAVAYTSQNVFPYLLKNSINQPVQSFIMSISCTFKSSKRIKSSPSQTNELLLLHFGLSLSHLRGLEPVALQVLYVEYTLNLSVCSVLPRCE